MRRLKWFSLCTLIILGSTDLHAEGDTRQFNVNPGNMMGGMMNPMRNMFGGYDRNQGGYYDNYDAPYYAPQPIHTTTPRDMAPIPAQATLRLRLVMQHLQPSIRQSRLPAAQSTGSTDSRLPAAGRSSLSTATTDDAAGDPLRQCSPGAVQFRPMDQPSTMQDSAQPATPTYAQPQIAEPQGGTAYYGNPAPSAAQGYQQQPQVPVEPSMKFRPLDQPGYAQ